MTVVPIDSCSGGAVKQAHAKRVTDLLLDLRTESHSPTTEHPPLTLTQRMQELFTPGVSLAVIDDFDIAWLGGFGTVGWEEKADAVSADTLFQAASISKPVFALAVMRLAKAGKIDLDADINSYLVSWRLPGNRDWTPRPTLRQLLSHTAGTTEHGLAGYSTSDPWPTSIQTLNGVPPANNMAVIVDLLPGLHARYSGGGTTVAQQVVTDVTGRPFPELMRELVLDPLQMTRSTFEQPLSARFARDAAIGHAWIGSPVRGGWHVYPEMAAAGLWTTAHDLARLGVELMRILRGQSSALDLDRESIREMLQPQLPDQKIGQQYWGVGWECSGEGDAFRFGHGGRNEGYVSRIILSPGRGQGAVVMLNSNRGFPLRQEIPDAVGRHYGWPSVANKQTIAAMISDVDYAGTYRDPNGFLFRVTQTDQGLRLWFGKQDAISLRPVSDMEFAADAFDLKARFDAKEDGTIVSMAVSQAGKLVTAGRLADPNDPHSTRTS